ncbi:MAG TPA: hypothetical protein ENN19_00930 [Chloroflexi bacterium]|nr:hypothetical protein [Chloroflexota bacterium]
MNEKETPAWIAVWAEHIATSGLSPIVLPCLDVARAFGFLGSQALLLVQPLAIHLAPESTLERISILLDDPELLRLLQAYLTEER